MNKISFFTALLASCITAIILAAIEFYVMNFIVAGKIALIAAIVFAVSFSVNEFFIFKKIKRITNIVKAQQTVHHRQSKNILLELEREINLLLKEKKDETERLKKLEMYRKEFLGNVSHELKTPVFNIQGYILTLLDGGWKDEKINTEYLQRTEKNIERMNSIIDDLEAITQLESGELQLETEMFDIVSLTKDVVEEIKEKNIVVGHYDEKPVFVWADKFRIRQVLSNLIVNSIKYGKENGETKINFRDAGETIVVEVSDNGIGIAKEHIPRIFERFYRIDKSRSRSQGGTGLGLAIVKHIVEAHGQTVSVLSTPDAGSVFSFSLMKGSG